MRWVLWFSKALVKKPRTVTRDGKTFIQHYWVKPDEASAPTAPRVRTLQKLAAGAFEMPRSGPFRDKAVEEIAAELLEVVNWGKINAVAANVEASDVDSALFLSLLGQWSNHGSFTPADLKDPVGGHRTISRCDEATEAEIQAQIGNTERNHNFGLELLAAFDLEYEHLGFDERAAKVGNVRQRLYHSGRNQRMLSAVTTGLKTPNQVGSVTGAMFGPGIYFADVASKSAQYLGEAFTNRDDNTVGVLFECDVVLGNTYHTQRVLQPWFDRRGYFEGDNYTNARLDAAFQIAVSDIANAYTYGKPVPTSATYKVGSHRRRRGLQIGQLNDYVAVVSEWARKGITKDFDRAIAKPTRDPDTPPYSDEKRRLLGVTHGPAYQELERLIRKAGEPVDAASCAKYWPKAVRNTMRHLSPEAQQYVTRNFGRQWYEEATLEVQQAWNRRYRADNPYLKALYAFDSLDVTLRHEYLKPQGDSLPLSEMMGYLSNYTFQLYQHMFSQSSQSFLGYIKDPTERQKAVEATLELADAAIKTFASEQDARHNTQHARVSIQDVVALMFWPIMRQTMADALEVTLTPPSQRSPVSSFSIVNGYVVNGKVAIDVYSSAMQKVLQEALAKAGVTGDPQNLEGFISEVTGVLAQQSEIRVEELVTRVGLTARHYGFDPAPVCRYLMENAGQVFDDLIQSFDIADGELVAASVVRNTDFSPLLNEIFKQACANTKIDPKEQGIDVDALPSVELPKGFHAGVLPSGFFATEKFHSLSAAKGGSLRHNEYVVYHQDLARIRRALLVKRTKKQ